MAPREVSKSDCRLAARCAAIASLGAAVIHIGVAPMHWRDWLPSGVFFAVLAGFQLLWALMAWSRQNTVLLAAGVAVNLGAAGLWVMSCIVGPPVGPSAGQPESVGTAGICVLLLQLYVVMGAGWAWSRKRQAEDVSGFGRAVVLMGANTIVAGAVTLGLAASLQGHHHHHGGAAEAQREHDGHRGSHMGGETSHMGGETQPGGHHHPSGPQSPPAAGVVTDMSLEADADRHSGPVAPTTKPALTQPPSNAADPAADADGHQHHHAD